MKDYNFMVSDDRLHKTIFRRKSGGVGRGGWWWLSKTFLIKRGVGAKRGGVLERFHFLMGGDAQKEGVTFLRVVSYPGAHYSMNVTVRHAFH